MNEFLVNLGFSLGLSTATLTLVDIILSADQKKWIVKNAEILWIWLDDQRTGKFIKLFLHQKTQYILFAIFSLVFVTGDFFLYITNDSAKHFSDFSKDWIYKISNASIEVILILGATFISYKFLHPKFLRLIGYKESLMWYLTVTLFLSIVLGMSTQYFVEWIDSLKLTGDIRVEDSADYTARELIAKTKSNEDVIWLFFMSIILVNLTAELIVFAFLFSVALIWSIIVMIVIAIFRVVQIAAIRIAENPKGPIMAVSGFLTAFSAIVKYFLPG
ncbi:hypothetical protein [Dyadobacter bucti]|uniref:hypothetical protein n=1 Tax=Dyadobacter bucti TaxID=2572203 RepID=UPI001109FDDD|nr:hypothetical protein [Dyadobacter bucti]